MDGHSRATPDGCSGEEGRGGRQRRGGAHTTESIEKCIRAGGYPGLVPASPPEPQSFSRVLEVQRRTGELLAEHVRALEEGWVLRTPSLPAVWALNHVRVTGEITPDRAVELCRTHLDGLTFHHLLIEDEATGLRLAEALRPAGWEVDVELHSVLAR